MSTFILTCAPSCCSLRELRLATWRCEVLGRVSPCRVGWRSLAVVALGREMVTLSDEHIGKPSNWHLLPIRALHRVFL